ncbi:hypothetical protein IQ07DRAFT_642987 [Pyrenochaeta sp. DS3sAY3a]|nr:hypothetical protein IQ07DRAFT_642987 [Pyrenochaeta sp. DS3sAY3a]
MADVTEVRCWPSCVDAVDWSQDNIIALASDEQVELLFPNTISFDRFQQSAQWEHVSLKAHLFSTDELPIKNPAALSNFSIGEEISNSVPTALAWSPPGLAKHRRCALAVLTSNLVLSIWSAHGKPQAASRWTRDLVINTALADYFLNQVTDDGLSYLTSQEERIRSRSRIRSFAWAPALPDRITNATVGTRLSYGQSFIIVSTDDNQVAFVVVESPTSTLDVARPWTAKVLAHFSVAPQDPIAEPLTFEDMMRQQRHISHVAWSPWLVQDDGFCSIVVYATNEDVRARIVTFNSEGIRFGSEVSYGDIKLRHNGPIKWCPSACDAEDFQLALFSHSGLFCLTVSGRDASIIGQTTHTLDDRWDIISGAAWEVNEGSDARLHFSSLASTLENRTALLEVSSMGLMRLKSPNWRDQIENQMVLFSVKNELKGNVQAKVWGLTLSPCGDFMVACSSLHPSDMIEYGPPSDRRSTVAISTLQPYSQLHNSFPFKHMSAEGVMFTVKRLAENTVEDEKKMPEFVKEMVNNLTQTFKSPGYSRKYDVTVDPSDAKYVEALLERLKRTAVLNQNTLNNRYTILVSQACATSDSVDVCRTLIGYRLALSVQNLPASLSETSFSAEVLTQHRCLASLIKRLTDPGTVTVDSSKKKSSTSTMGISMTGSNVESNQSTSHNQPAGNVQTTGEPPRAGQKQIPAETAGLDASSGSDQAGDKQPAEKPKVSVEVSDICDFCSAPIPFQDLTEARCLNGHRSPRCGLSFIAIQAPGITKYCGICDTPFLSDEFVALQEKDEEQEGVETTTDQSADSLQEPSGVSGSTQDDISPGSTAGAVMTGVKKAESPVTLARILFQACDMCIYCGGKFVS